ncbi:MAG TPA: hypothetical protein VF033_15400, partial [Steroidobacteraceae bacterium]
AAWVLDPTVSLILVAILRAEQVTARYRVRTGPWVRRAKWLTLTATYVMNTWAPSPRRQIEVQAEYLRREESGQVTFDPQDTAVPVAYDNRQEGWYLQSVYQFAARWRAGLRYDRLDSGNPRYRPLEIGVVDFGQIAALHPERLSAMLDWNPSEFTRIRAQYDFDDARDDGPRDRVFRLQYLFGIGAHGAHKY